MCSEAIDRHIFLLPIGFGNLQSSAFYSNYLVIFVRLTRVSFMSIFGFSKMLRPSDRWRSSLTDLRQVCVLFVSINFSWVAYVIFYAALARNQCWYSEIGSVIKCMTIINTPDLSRIFLPINELWHVLTIRFHRR